MSGKLEERRRRLQAAKVKIDALCRCDDSAQAAFTYLVAKVDGTLSEDTPRERLRDLGLHTDGCKAQLVGRLEAAMRVPVPRAVLEAASPVLKEACSLAPGSCLLPIDCEAPELNIIAQALVSDAKDVLAIRMADGEQESVLRIIMHAAALGLHDMAIAAATLCFAALETPVCASGDGLKLLDVTARAMRASGGRMAAEKWVGTLANLVQSVNAKSDGDVTLERFIERPFGGHDAWGSIAAPSLALIARALPADVNELLPLTWWTQGEFMRTLWAGCETTCFSLALPDSELDGERVALTMQLHLSGSSLTGVSVSSAAVPLCMDIHVCVGAANTKVLGAFLNSNPTCVKAQSAVQCTWSDLMKVEVCVRRAASNARINLLLDWLRENPSPHVKLPELPRRAPLQPAMWCELLAYVDVAHGDVDELDKGVFDDIVLPHASRHFAKISACAEFANVPLRITKWLVAQRLSSGAAGGDSVVSTAVRWAVANVNLGRAPDAVQLVESLGLADLSWAEMQALIAGVGELRDACAAFAPLREAVAGELARGLTAHAHSPKSPSEELICPITHELLKDATLLVADGHTYSKASLERWLRDHDTSPTTGAALASKTTVENWAVRKMVEEAHERSTKRRRLLSPVAVAADEAFELDGPARAPSACALSTASAMLQEWLAESSRCDPKVAKDDDGIASH